MFRILLIEDDPADVVLFREALRATSIDADLLVAYDGEQGLRFLTELAIKPDLVVLDVNIPKLDGITILENYNVHVGPPVIVFSNSVDPENEKRVLQLGAQQLVTKPIQFAEFQKAVRDILEKWLPSSTLVDFHNALQETNVRSTNRSKT